MLAGRQRHKLDVVADGGDFLCLCPHGSELAASAHSPDLPLIGMKAPRRGLAGDSLLGCETNNTEAAAGV